MKNLERPQEPGVYGTTPPESKEGALYTVIQGVDESVPKATAKKTKYRVEGESVPV